MHIEKCHRRDRKSTASTGFIVQRQGDLYTIVTNQYVVCKITSTQKCAVPPAAASYIVTIPDGQQHPVSAMGIKILGTDVDLEIVQFPQSQAQIDTSASLKADDVIYTTGFLALKPAFSGAYLNHGDAKLRLVNLQGALSDSDRAISIEPDNPTYYGFRAVVKLKLNDRQGAKSDLDRNAHSVPRSPTSYYFSSTLKKNLFEDRSGALVKAIEV